MRLTYPCNRLTVSPLLALTAQYAQPRGAPTAASWPLSQPAKSFILHMLIAIVI